MTIRAKGPLIALLVLTTGIAACSSAPPATDAAVPALPRFFDPAKDPYWQDPRWAKSLLDATQSVVHDPVPVTDMTTVGPRATIKFTFADGRIQDPAIIAGTGDPALDELLLKQVLTAQVPKPTGLHADEAHGFLLDVDMPTPFESFQSSVYAAIDHYKIFPKGALLSGAIGATTLDFDYRDGAATGIAIVKSSKDKDLDKASLDALMRAAMPPAPTAYAGKTWHMEAIVCYTINESNNCPDTKNTILVTATRIKTVTTTTFRPY